MTVINIIITQSSEQIVSGFPKSIALSTNIPSSIFYTLDGKDPTLFSNIYTGPILLPFEQLSITLKIFATNGVDSSPILTETYITNILNNTRLPHSPTDVQPNSSIPDLYPFGTNPCQPMGHYLNPAEGGITVDNPLLTTIPSGFGADGYPNAFTNQPFTVENYNIKITENDFLNQPLVGVLPGNAKIELEKPIPETTEQFSNMFDPRALVIFQDFSKENPNDPPQINRQFFTLENPETARDGNAFFTSGLDAPAPSGSFLRSHYNPRDNTMTYYYLDTWSNRWIISKQEFKPTGSFDGNLSGIVASGRGAGSNFVQEWIPYRYRTLI